MGTEDFRTRQVLADMGHLASFRSVPDPWTVVFDPDAAPAILWPTLAALLKQGIEGEAPDPILADLWDLHRKAVAKAPAQIRAALMNGFQCIRNLALAEVADAPAKTDLVTSSLKKLAPPLIAIARHMTPEECDHVARADYGCDVARHRAALDVLLDDPAVAYPPGEYWYPAEVVELVSYAPGKPGHVPCLAIVLLNALRNEDRQGDAEFRLAQQWTAIAALDPAVRDAFFAAFRHLYESLDHWSPSVPEPFTLPWVSLP